MSFRWDSLFDGFAYNSQIERFDRDVTMDTVTANEAKTRFGELLLRSQREPVQISRNGKPVAILISAEDFESVEALKLQLLQTRANRALAEIEAGTTVDGEDFFDELEKGKFD